MCWETMCSSLSLPTVAGASREVHFHLLELTCKGEPINHTKDSLEHAPFN